MSRKVPNIPKKLDDVIIQKQIKAESLLLER